MVAGEELARSLVFKPSYRAEKSMESFSASVYNNLRRIVK
jgi:hypothetical protein